MKWLVGNLVTERRFVDCVICIICRWRNNKTAADDDLSSVINYKVYSAIHKVIKNDEY